MKIRYTILMVFVVALAFALIYLNVPHQRMDRCLVKKAMERCDSNAFFTRYDKQSGLDFIYTCENQNNAVLHEFDFYSICICNPDIEEDICIKLYLSGKGERVE
jgi:hypothetical protein